MATLISRATGNLTSASTWGVCSSGSGAQLTDLTQTDSSSSTQTKYSYNFTGTSGDVVDGIALFLKRASLLGTFTAILSADGGTTATRSVTVNVSDLPADESWVFFAFGSSLTLNGGATYRVGVASSSDASVNVYCDSGTRNFGRLLRTTTTKAPAAGDAMLICGQWTAAATSSAYTVTMDATAVVAYGTGVATSPTQTAPGALNGISIGQSGTLRWGTSASTTYVLQLAGSLAVWSGGTYQQGTSGTPVPTGSRATLQFACAADGDYGLLAFNGATVSVYGAARTSGKSQWKALLSASSPSTANLVSGLSGSANAATVAVANALGPDGLSLTASTLTDTTANSSHHVSFTSSGGSLVGNTTQTASIWLARGSGTNNRYARLVLGNAAGPAPTNGFYADVDLQSGTIGTCTALGNGTATSAAISAVGGGYRCTIIGRVSSSNATPILSVCAANSSGGISYAGDATQSLLYYGAQLFTASALPSSTLTINTDTGWLSGDVVAIASTSRTAAESELMVLASNATTSAIACGMPLVNSHAGASPTQAEVALLTRNVVVRSTSPAVMAYVYAGATAAVTLAWSEFAYLGASASQKRGIEIGTTTGSFSMTYCSVHDGDCGITYGTASANAGFTVQYCTLWNCGGAGVAAVNCVSGITSTSYTVDNVVVIKAVDGFSFGDVGGTLAALTAVSCSGVGIKLSEAGAALGAQAGFSWVAHSNGGTGVELTAATGTLAGPAIWRNAGTGIVTAAGVTLYLSTLFGNGSQNISLGAGVSVLDAVTSDSDTSFSTPTGVLVNAGAICRIIGCNFSTGTGTKTAHTQDIAVASASSAQVRCINTRLSASTQVSGPSNFVDSESFVSAARLGTTAGSHRTWKRAGTILRDTAVYNAAAPSERLTPNSSSIKLESGSRLVPINSGQVLTVSVAVRKSVSGDGSAYNGNQPRLVVKRNNAVGITADTVLATMTGGAGSWIVVSGATPAATDDGVVELVVNCDGTSGWINVDDWSVNG